MGCNCTRLSSAQVTSSDAAARFQPLALDSDSAGSGSKATPLPGYGAESFTDGAANPTSEPPNNMDVPSPCISKTPALLQVRAFPSKVSIVRSNTKVEVTVEEVAAQLAQEYSVTVDQALEALRWSNFDPDDASAVLLQVAEIDAFERKTGEASSSLANKAATGTKRLLGFLSSSRTERPALVIAEFAKLVAERKLTDQVPPQNGPSRKRARETVTIKPRLPAALSAPSHRDESRRSAYFAAKCEVRTSTSDFNGTPLNLPTLQSDNGDAVLDIIVESSVMGHYLMPPWSEEDPDVKTNFWIDVPPHTIYSHKRDERKTALDLVRSVSAREQARSNQPQESLAFSFNPEDVSLAGWNALDDQRWTDPDGKIALSEKQISKIHQWKRIPELEVPIPSQKDPQGRKEPSSSSSLIGPDGIALKPGDPLFPLIITDRPRARAIRQGFVGDCSFLSSLASLAEYESRLKVPVVSSLLFPQSRQMTSTGHLKVEPLINPNGMYACKLHFNGILRKVQVDDFVPVRKDGKLLAAHSAHKREMWVTLLEKAFVKLMGGSYFMHGSNPGADLYHLTGWIPETVPFRKDVHTGSPDFYSPVVTGGAESSALSKDPRWRLVWDQLYAGFARGSCVACLGTSEVADAAPSGLDFPEGVSLSSGIVARHAYSVLNCREVHGHRLLYVRNPWACVRWKGRFGPGDSAWTPELEEILGYDSKAALKSDNGSFWIDWQDVVTWFSHLYVCWNSIFFQFESVLHSRWGTSDFLRDSLLLDDSHNVAFNPQFHVKVAPIIIEDMSPDDAPIADLWILLSRHVRDRKRDLFQKYIAVHVYSGFERVCCPQVPTQQGVYSNGECALMRVRVRRARVHAAELDSEERRYWRALNRTEHRVTPPSFYDAASAASILDDQDLVLVVSQYSQKTPFNFTFKVFSAAPVMVRELPPLLPAKQWTTLSVKSEWSPSTAGGCSNDIWQFFKNPHYRLWLPRACEAKVFLECPEELSLNVRIFRGPFSSARLLRTGRAISSGPYRAACCLIEADLEPGPYTIVVSNFNAGDVSRFQLRIHLSLQPGECERVSSLNQTWEVLAVSMDSKQFVAPTLGVILPSRHQHLKQLHGVTSGSQAAQQASRALGYDPGFGFWPLPTSYAIPPHAPLRAQTVSSTSERFVGVFKLSVPRRVATVALRLVEDGISPGYYRPTLTVIFAMSPSHPLLRKSSDPRVHMPVFDPSEFNGTLPEAPLSLIKRSDLDGGLSDDGRVPSTAAAQLYQKKHMVCMSNFLVFNSALVHGTYFVLVDSVLVEDGSFSKPSSWSNTQPLAAPQRRAVMGRYRLSVISDEEVTLSSFGQIM